MQIAVHVGRELAALQQAQRALAVVKALVATEQVREHAEAARRCASSAHLDPRVQNSATELKLRADREAGKLLAGLQLRGGDHRPNSHDESLRLSDFGIGHNESARLQQQAAVPEPIFEQYLRDGAAGRGELSAAGLLRFARECRTGSGDANERSRTTAEDHAGMGEAQRAFDTRESAVAARNARQSHDFGPQVVGEVRESVQELLNHHVQLEQLLARVVGGSHGQPDSAMRRQIERLLADCVRRLQEMDRLVSREARKHGRR